MATAAKLYDSWAIGEVRPGEPTTQVAVPVRYFEHFGETAPSSAQQDIIGANQKIATLAEVHQLLVFILTLSVVFVLWGGPYLFIQSRPTSRLAKCLGRNRRALFGVSMLASTALLLYVTAFLTPDLKPATVCAHCNYIVGAYRSIGSSFSQN